MTLLLLVQKLFAYGCLGVLIEFFFTAIGSLIRRNWKGTGISYIWMPLIYGFAALALEAVSNAVPWPFYLKALLYVPIIYGIEGLSGWTLMKLIGTIPWDYQRSNWTPMGLINFKYAPFWLLLAMAFDPITGFLTRLLRALAVVTS